MSSKALRLLRGVKIVSFTQFLLGPAAVQYLGDMGADIITVEPPGGAYERRWSGGDTYLNGMSAFYMLYHRNVRSITLNLKTQAGKEVAKRLIQQADVMVENFRPGIMEGLELGYDHAREVNPSIIYACASGYGSDSQFQNLPGQDLLIQALSGLAAITGHIGQSPVPVGAAVVDQHGAALLAMGILGALFERERTGKGQRVEVVMMQAAFDLQSEPVVTYLNGGDFRMPEQPLASAFHQAPYGLYQTSDGWLALSITPLVTIANALGNPSELQPLTDPGLAFEKKDEIYRALAPILRLKSTDQWVDELRPKGVWCAPVNDYSKVFADPMVHSVDPTFEMDHPVAGKVRLLKHPVRYSSGEPDLRQPPPTLGQHTEEVLRSLGYKADTIAAFRADGVL